MSEMEGTHGTNIEVNLKDRKILVRPIDSHIYSHEVLVIREGKEHPVARVKALRYAVDLLHNLIEGKHL